MYYYLFRYLITNFNEHCPLQSELALQEKIHTKVIFENNHLISDHFAKSCNIHYKITNKVGHNKASGS